MKNFLIALYILLFSLASAQNGRSGKVEIAKPSSESMKAGAFINVNTAQYPESNFSIEQLITNVCQSLKPKL